MKFLKKPFTYLLTFKPTGHFYVGVSFKKGTSPEVMGSSYFSSSIFVQDLFKSFPHLWRVEIIEQGSSEEMRDLEEKILKRINIESTFCLNENVTGAISREFCRKGGLEVFARGTGIASKTSEELAQQGRKTYEDKIGCHGMSIEAQRERSQRGGRTAGIKTYREGTGVHGLNKHQRVKNAKKAGKVSAEKRRLNGDPFAKPIYCISLKRKFESAAQAEKILGLKKGSQKGISHCVRGDRRSAYGHRWCNFFEDEKELNHEIKRRMSEVAGSGAWQKKQNN